MELVVSLIAVFGLLVLGVVVGGANERAHLKQLKKHERRLGHIRVCNLKRVADPGSVMRSQIVIGQVVIATDYFKSWATSLRNLIGGEMQSAQSLMVRARREALVRLLQEAEHQGATEVWNLRYGFCNIAMMRGKTGTMQVEIVAWGTAVKRA